jgi:hypothetical protein
MPEQKTIMDEFDEKFHSKNEFDKFPRRIADPMLCDELKEFIIYATEQARAETIKEILQILEKEDDWMEMHKVENNYESGIRVGFGTAIGMIRSLN